MANFPRPLSDDYYRTTFRYPSTPEMERRFGHLVSMTPKQELFECVMRRALAWTDVREYRKAAETLLMASNLDPEFDNCRHALHAMTRAWRNHHYSRRPPGFPLVEVDARNVRRRWPSIPEWLEKEVRFLQTADDVLHDPHHDKHHWTPLRLGLLPSSRVPARIVVTTNG